MAERASGVFGQEMSQKGHRTGGPGGIKHKHTHAHTRFASGSFWLACGPRAPSHIDGVPEDWYRRIQAGSFTERKDGGRGQGLSAQKLRACLPGLKPPSIQKHVRLLLVMRKLCSRTSFAVQQSRAKKTGHVCGDSARRHIPPSYSTINFGLPTAAFRD